MQLRYSAYVNDPKYSIINDPDDTMNHPMINDVTADAVGRILKNQEDGGRNNSLFAVVAGIGRGKTRLLVELDAALRNYTFGDKQILPIAITFNKNWGATKFKR